MTTLLPAWLATHKNRLEVERSLLDKPDCDDLTKRGAWDEACRVANAAEKDAAARITKKYPTVVYRDETGSLYVFRRGMSWIPGHLFIDHWKMSVVRGPQKWTPLVEGNYMVSVVGLILGEVFIDWNAANALNIAATRIATLSECGIANGPPPEDWPPLSLGEALAAGSFASVVRGHGMSWTRLHWLRAAPVDFQRLQADKHRLAEWGDRRVALLVENHGTDEDDEPCTYPVGARGRAWLEHGEDSPETKYLRVDMDAGGSLYFDEDEVFCDAPAIRLIEESDDVGGGA